MQLCYELTPSPQWRTVGFGADRQAALRHLEAYRGRPDSDGRLPERARVVGGEELRSEGGDAAVLRAVDELAKRATN